MMRIFYFWLIVFIGWAVDTSGELYGIQHYVLGAEQTATQLIAFIVLLIWMFGIGGLTLWLAFNVLDPLKWGKQVPLSRTPPIDSQGEKAEN